MRIADENDVKTIIPCPKCRHFTKSTSWFFRRHRPKYDQEGKLDDLQKMIEDCQCYGYTIVNGNSNQKYFKNECPNFRQRLSFGEADYEYRHDIIKYCHVHFMCVSDSCCTGMCKHCMLRYLINLDKVTNQY